MHIDIILYGIGTSVLESFAQVSLKGGNLYLGIVLYGCVGYLLFRLYQKFLLSTFNIVWSSVSIISAALIGYLVYKEEISVYKRFSILLALGAIYFADYHHD